MQVDDDPEIDRAAALARWADSRLLDPLVGLVLPGAGDVLGALVGLHIVRVALRRRAPKVVVARMLLNLALDALLGAIPLAGDLFDLVYRANLKNVALLRQRAAAGKVSARAGDWLVVAGAALVFLAALILPAVFLVKVLAALGR